MRRVGCTLVGCRAKPIAAELPSPYLEDVNDSLACGRFPRPEMSSGLGDLT